MRKERLTHARVGDVELWIELEAMKPPAAPAVVPVDIDPPVDVAEAERRSLEELLDHTGISVDEMLAMLPKVEA